MHIVILGYLVRGPLGGASWHFLQYVIGFKKLGHEVLFLEDSDDFASCYNPITYETTTDPTLGIAFVQGLFKKYDLQDKWAYYDEHTNTWFGQTKEKVLHFCKNADVVLNIANIHPLRDWWGKIPVRILLDTDPAFTQLRHLEEERYRKIAESHNHFFSFGENFGSEDCKIPDDGFPWKPTRQPVVSDIWTVAPPADENRGWTTVTQWDAYKVRQYNGFEFGMKSASFVDYFPLPQKIKETMELAVVGKAPIEKLEINGWRLINPLAISLTPDDFRNYIAQSKGEWSVAKQGYVVSKSGWFSERSTDYLAMGRPVVVQDTGFSKVIETGKGLLAFTSLDEAVEAINEVNGNYAQHCQWAKEITETFFRSDIVLSSMLDRVND